MQLIVWEYFNSSYREYLIFRFDDDGTPSEDCRVFTRAQGCPSKHVVTVTRGNETLLDKSMGRNMNNGQYFLPKQYHTIKRYNGLIELDITAYEPSDRLPNYCWFQYNRIRIKWKKVQKYFPFRDHGPNNLCYVYMPCKIVV
jgi:hypothetical protein